MQRLAEPAAKRKNGLLNNRNAKAAADLFLREAPACPRDMAGRGVVIGGGGAVYFKCAWVCVNMLRHLGCALPIQLWHLGPDELDAQMAEWVRPLGVECVDGLKVRETRPARILNGWELKAYSIVNSPFKEVLFLDADNVPVVNPEYLFETPEYKETGAVFWPDFGRLKPSSLIWNLCGVAYRDEPEFESGQIIADKKKCWTALSLAMWYNERSDFFYRHIHGDKETFHMAFRRLNQPFSMPTRPIHSLENVVMCQHDFEGKRVFQHRNLAKWRLFARNRRIKGFAMEKECLKFLADLRKKWAASEDGLFRKLCG